MRLLRCGTFSLSDGLPLAERLAHIHDGLAEIVAAESPDAVSVETVFHGMNPRTALVLGQARGAALAAVGAGTRPVHEYAAGEIKRAVTGNGRAGKEQVSKMVGILLGVSSPGDEHACDALAAAICHLHRMRPAGVFR